LKVVCAYQFKAELYTDFLTGQDSSGQSLAGIPPSLPGLMLYTSEMAIITADFGLW
jgi:hypothetical protein